MFALILKYAILFLYIFSKQVENYRQNIYNIITTYIHDVKQKTSVCVCAMQCRINVRSGRQKLDIRDISGYQG